MYNPFFLFPSGGQWENIKILNRRNFYKKALNNRSQPNVIITNCDISGSLSRKLVSVNNIDTLIFKAIITGHATGKGWGNSILYSSLPSGFMIRNFRQLDKPTDSEKEIYLLKKNDVSIVVKAPSNFKAEFEIIAPLTVINKQINIDLPVPAAGLGMLHMEYFSDREATLTSRPVSIVSSIFDNNIQSFDINLITGSVMKLRFVDNDYSTGQISYKVFQQLGVSVSPDELRTTIKIRLSEIKGLPEKIVLQLSGQDSIAGIVGNNVKSWKSAGVLNNRMEVTVELFKTRPQELTFDMFLDGTSDAHGKFHVPVVDLKKSIQTRGTIEVQQSKGYFIIEEMSSGVVRIKKNNNDIGYSFSGSSMKLVLSMKKIPILFDISCNTLKTYWPDSIRSLSKIKLEVVSGILEKIFINVPADFKTEIVTGKMLAGWKPVKGGIEVFLSGAKPGSSSELQLEGFTLNKSDGKENRKILLWVPEFRNARDVAGKIALNVISDLIPEKVSKIDFSMRRLALKDLPLWMRNSHIGFIYNGSNVTSDIQLLKPVPSIRVESVSLLEITKLTLISETVYNLEVRDGPLFNVSFDIGTNDELDDISGFVLSTKDEKISEYSENIISETSRVGNVLTVYFNKPVKPARNKNIYARIKISKTTNLKSLSVKKDFYGFPVPTVRGQKDIKGYIVIKSRTSKELDWKKTSDTRIEECSISVLPFKWFGSSEGDIVLRYFNTGRALIEAKFPKPKFTTSSQTLFLINVSAVNAAARVDFDISRGELDHIIVRLPSGAKQLAVKTSNFKECTELGKNKWRVAFSSAIKGRTIINFEYSIPLSPTTDSVIIAPPLVSGSSRNKGLMGFKSVPELELTEGYNALKGITRYSGKKPVNLRDVGDVYRLKGNEQPELKLLISNVKRQNKLKARIIKCSLQSVIEKGGTIFNTVTADILNPGDKQFMLFSLPANSQLWGVFIDDKPVKAGIREDNKAKFTVPLLVGKGNKSFSAKLMFRQIHVNTSDFSRIKNMKLNSPEFDLPVENSEWKVYIPDGYKIITPKGNMKLTSIPSVGKRGFSIILLDSMNEVVFVSEKYFAALSRVLSLIFTRKVKEIGYLILGSALVIMTIFMLSMLIGWIFKKLFRLTFRFQYTFSGVVTMVIIMFFMFAIMTVQKSSSKYTLKNVESEFSDKIGSVGEKSKLNSIIAQKTESSGLHRQDNQMMDAPQIVSELKSPSPDVISGSNSMQSNEEMKKILARASRQIQKRDYDGAMKNYNQLKGSKYKKQAEVAMKSLREMNKQKASQKKKTRLSAGEMENKRKINDINNLYVDRAMAQTVVAQKSGLKGYKYKELERMVKNKLDDAESQLLSLKDSKDRKHALNQIAFARKQLKPRNQPQKIQQLVLAEPSVRGSQASSSQVNKAFYFDLDEESDDGIGDIGTVEKEMIFFKANEKKPVRKSRPRKRRRKVKRASKKYSRAPTSSVRGNFHGDGIGKQNIPGDYSTGLSFQKKDSDKSKNQTSTSVFTEKDLINSGIINAGKGSSISKKNALLEKLGKSGAKDARVSVYGNQYVVISNNLKSKKIVDRMKRMQKTQQPSMPSEYRIENIARKRALKKKSEKKTDFKFEQNFQQMKISKTINLSAINGGRSKGALPVFVEVPRFSNPYIFTRSRSVDAGAEIIFRYIPENSILALVIAVSGILLLLISTIIFIFPKSEEDK